MHRASLLCCVFALISSSSLAAKADGQCTTYYAIAPMDAQTLKSLSTPVVPARTNEFSNARIRQIQKWDLPSDVTPWQSRPSVEELARQWDELNKKFSSSSNPAMTRPYSVAPVPSADWSDLEKWFGQEAPKRISGACVDDTKASYVLVVGIVSSGGGNASDGGASDRIQYQQSTTARRQDASVGGNAATFNPVGVDNRADQLSGLNGGGSAGHTCVFLYRIEGGGRQQNPEYYYCKADGVMPKSAVSTLLKYLGKKTAK